MMNCLRLTEKSRNRTHNTTTARVQRKPAERMWPAVHNYPFGKSIGKQKGRALERYANCSRANGLAWWDEINYAKTEKNPHHSVRKEGW